MYMDLVDKVNEQCPLVGSLFPIYLKLGGQVYFQYPIVDSFGINVASTDQNENISLDNMLLEIEPQTGKWYSNLFHTCTQLLVNLNIIILATSSLIWKDILITLQTVFYLL